MEITEMKDCLAELYLANVSRYKKFKKNNGGSVLLLGPPGIGKTTGTHETGETLAGLHLKKKFISYQDHLANEILNNPEKYFLFVYFNLHTIEPSDLGGFPKEHDKGMTYKPPLWVVCLSKAGGILFLDEFTNIQRLDILSVSQNIILEHRSGFTEFSGEVMVIAAGNSPKESSLANLLPVPVVDKFTTYEVSCPKLDSWVNWMDKHFSDEWDKRTLGYLMHFREEFLNLPSEIETLTNFPTPRSWTENATRLPLISQKFHRETLIGSLGPETGEKFYAFLNADIPSAEELLKNPELFNKLDLDGKYLAAVLAGTDLKNRFEKHAEEKNKQEEIVKTLPLLQMMKNAQQDFIILTIISGGNLKRDIALALGRKDKGIGKILTEVATLGINLEV